MSLPKYIFDFTLAVALSIVLLPLIVVIFFVVMLCDGFPVFYISERMKSAHQGFQLVKFRTMTVAKDDDGASGGHKTARITPIGAILRKSRLDEIPQLWNVLKGDVSFVGPRPPLRVYVERFPKIYEQVLKNRPGITGLASVYFHEHEERLLKATKTEDENDKVYCGVCIPKKAKIDLIYQKHSSLRLDISIMLKTVFKRLR